MRTQRTDYSSPLDALIAITKRLNGYEIRHTMTSESFFDSYNRGELPDDSQFIEWANDYRHYLSIRTTLEKKLQHAA